MIASNSIDYLLDNEDCIFVETQEQQLWRELFGLFIKETQDDGNV